MRASAKWIMAVVAVSFVGWMVFEVGMDLSGQTSGGALDEIARVNGTKIDGVTYETAVRNAQEQQRQSGTPILTLDDDRALRDQVLESLVQQIVLQQEYKRRGIEVTDDEIRDAARNAPLPEMLQVPEFQTEGQFDFEKYQRFLSSGTDPSFLFALEARYRDELPRLKLFDRVTSDVFIPDTKLWRDFRDQFDTVSTRIMTILPEAVVPDAEVSVTDEEVEVYFREHSDDYAQPARARLSFIRVSREPNASDTAAALERAESTVEELRNGADFAEVAQRESADSASRAKGGDLGEVAFNAFDSTFTAAALALRPGQISEPVFTPFGIHIIKLESKSSETYGSRHILIPIELTGEHLREIDERGDSLDTFAAEQDDPTALDSAAATLRVAVSVAPPLTEGTRLRLGRNMIPDVGIWAFESVEGMTSHVVETNEGFYVFRLDELEPEGVPAIETIWEDVRRDAITEKKWERAGELADAVHADLQAGMPFVNAGVKHGLTPVTLPPFTRRQPNPSLGNAPEVVGSIFGLVPGETSGPIRTAQAIFFVQPTGLQPADSTGFAERIDELRQTAFQQAQQARWQLVFVALRENADVIDRRAEIARRLRELPDSPGSQNPFGF